jgi:hypothetical protein
MLELNSSSDMTLLYFMHGEQKGPVLVTGQAKCMLLQHPSGCFSVSPLCKTHVDTTCPLMSPTKNPP